ncbi:Gfo/Idh/MocA family protein [Asinibacterium sp. OR53]|uniref:Gfo/Idh/MocA family protein n=1 Tax=Asinibacterium sp. OR53 TaxID=925409 RepID=UPI00047DEFB1|nr:Gfo/Idh/MocA family oxidoreductase [Asinibacterium sp. OR53]
MGHTNNNLENISVLIIGLGSMGKRRIRNLQHIGVTKITGYDIREDRKNEAVSKYGINILKEFADVNKEDFSHLIVSTPPDEHVFYAMEGVKRGLHVFIEASVLSDGLLELQDLLNEVKIKNQVALVPSCTMRFDPIINKAKQIIDSGKLGRVLLANHHFGQYLPNWHPYERINDFYVSKKETGGAREIVPFDLVYLTWMFGKVKNVKAFLKNTQTLGVEIDDIYSLICETDTGTCLNVVIDVVSKVPYRETKVIFQNGNMEIDFNKGQLSVYSSDSNSWEYFTKARLSKTTSTEEMYVLEITNFIEISFEVVKPTYSIEDDHEVLNILYAAEKSFEERQEIKL